MRKPTFFLASGAESAECQHDATERANAYRVACLTCVATAYVRTPEGAAEVAEAVETIATWQADGVDPVEVWEAEDWRESGDDVAPSLADKVAEAEGLITSGDVDVADTLDTPVSGVLHGAVLLVLAEREGRDSRVTLREAAAHARVVAVVVESLRLSAAWFKFADAA